MLHAILARFDHDVGRTAGVAHPLLPMPVRGREQRQIGLPVLDRSDLEESSSSRASESKRPGMRYLPRPSTTVVPAGMGTRSAGPTAVIRPFTISTV
jgi:hypothetical protein